jgi:hypothetical protein
VDSLLQALAGLHAAGHWVDWKAFIEPLGGRAQPLPTYPFDRQRYWLETDRAGMGEAAQRHRTTSNASIQPPAAAESATAGDPPSTRSIESLIACTPGERREAVVEILRGLVAQALGKPASAVDCSASVLDLGMDSLTVMEVLNGLRLSLKVIFYPHEVFQRPRLDLLADYVVFEFDRMHVVSAPAPVPSPPNHAAPVPKLLPSAPVTPNDLLPQTRSPHRLIADAHGMEEEMVDVRGAATCLCTWGPPNGPTLLIVHGILDHGAAWDAVARSLAARGYRVVAPDLRGHGRSAHLATGASYHLIDFVADLDALALSSQCHMCSWDTRWGRRWRWHVRSLVPHGYALSFSSSRRFLTRRTFVCPKDFACTSMRCLSGHPIQCSQPRTQLFRRSSGLIPT